ncbi:MAG TPA: PIN domain-containing protein [Vicinamibacterales bacterium]|jgi:predicted nucleic acid-binding protein|nr:PIN domain-containing protein [Vicinamibacterales bacterium]
MIHLDTSALVAALTGRRPAAATLRKWIDTGIRPGVCTIVLYEWWRGPRSRQELTDQETLLPADTAFPFGVREAEIAADISRRLERVRQREIDIAIAACAIAQDAALWTLNPRDFRDIPGLEIAKP